jgi:pimeloyl-ACP methyl ester carboxylesterase
MKLELVSIPTDTHALDGLWYRPEQNARGAAMLLHGNCMNFYTGAPRFLPPHLTGLGLAALAYNRRGHDMVATLNSRAVSGGAFQMTKEAIADNVYAADWLKAQSFAAPVVIGHSNGGMLAVQHVADHPETPALVLLSAHLGGKSVVPLASKVGLLGGDRIDAVEAQARAMVAEGRGGELMVLPGWWHVITAQSYLDYCTELPDVLALSARITCPVLYIRGDKEPAHIYPAEEFAARSGGRCDVRIVKDCDHFYGGREEVVADIVTAWLDEVLAKT